MTRKLLSAMLCAFALLFLMGASAEAQQADTVMAQEESAVTEETEDTALELDIAETVEISAVSGASPLELANDHERGMKIDGAYPDLSVGLTQKNGVSYVSLPGMAQALDSSAKVSWNADTGVATITTSKMKMTAKVGQSYVEANGRYLYLPERVQKADGKVVLPLWLVAKAFDAQVSWDAENKVVIVTRGSGAIKSGDTFYNSDTLFWLSRVIYAESGNQSLDGQMAVGNVVMNRVKSPAFPNTIKEVLSQKYQFATWRDGDLANRTPNSSSVIAAKLVMDGGVVEKVKGALYFDATGTSWASRNRQLLAVIGAHYFYL